MDLNTLAKTLAIKLKTDLPGSVAHEPMRAVAIGELTPTFTHKIPPKPSSVLILLYEENGVLKFPLIKRNEYAGAHSGQISLPGGKTEAGENAVETALREAKEEIGVIKTDIQVIGLLSNFFVIPSNFLVSPVVAYLPYTPQFKPDPYEVERVIAANLNDILRADAIQEKEIIAAGKYRMRAPHFEIQNEIVWGATAMMLNEFRMLINSISY